MPEFVDVCRKPLDKENPAVQCSFLVQNFWEGEEEHFVADGRERGAKRPKEIG